MMASEAVFEFQAKNADEDTEDCAIRVLRGTVTAGDADFGLYIWPSARLLAQYMWRHQSEFRGKVVIELGSGCCLSGLLAAAIGCSVTLTDAAAYAHVLEKARDNVRLNSWSRRDLDEKEKDRTHSTHSTHFTRLGAGQARVLPLTWGRFSALTIGALRSPGPSLLIAADVFYDAKDFDDLLATVAFLECPLLVSFQHRGGSNRSVLFGLAQQWGFAIKVIVLDPNDYECLEDTNATLELFRLFRPTPPSPPAIGQEWPEWPTSGASAGR